MNTKIVALAMASALLLVAGPAVGAAESETISSRGETSDSSTEPNAAELQGRIIFSRFGGELGVGGEDPCWLWIADADGSEQDCLVVEEFVWPWAAPDGSRVDTVGFTDDGRETVQVIDLIDDSAQLLEPSEDATLKLTSGPFSRDRSRRALLGSDETDPTRNGIYVSPWTDVTDAVQVLQNEDIETWRAVDFSPDGQQLVLYHQVPGDLSDTHGWLDIINVDGTGLRRLTPEDIDLPCCASWSPDGERILFADLKGRMLTVDPAGDTVTELFVQEGGWVRHPDWSPDGSQIVFALDPVATPYTSPNVLYVANADGAALRPIIGTPDNKREIQWVPDIRDDS